MLARILANLMEATLRPGARAQPDRCEVLLAMRDSAVALPHPDCYTLPGVRFVADECPFSDDPATALALRCCVDAGRVPRNWVSRYGCKRSYAFRRSARPHTRGSRMGSGDGSGLQNRLEEPSDGDVLPALRRVYHRP